MGTVNVRRKKKTLTNQFLNLIWKARKKKKKKTKKEGELGRALLT